jgi:hypothetical protein
MICWQSSSILPTNPDAEVLGLEDHSVALQDDAVVVVVNRAVPRFFWIPWRAPSTVSGLRVTRRVTLRKTNTQI